MSFYLFSNVVQNHIAHCTEINNELQDHGHNMVSTRSSVGLISKVGEGNEFKDARDDDGWKREEEMNIGSQGWLDNNDNTRSVLNDWFGFCVDNFRGF